LNFIFVGIFLYTPFFGRALGMSVPTLTLFGNPLNRMEFFILCLGVVVIATLVIWWLQRSWVGLAWRAIREVQEIAEVMGVNVPKFKILAFLISTALAGIAGVLYAHFILFITPSDFVLANSIFALTLAIFGGLGTIRGPILGAIILTLLPEFLRFIQNYRNLTYGLLLVIILLFQPQGLFGDKSFLWRRLKALLGR